MVAVNNSTKAKQMKVEFSIGNRVSGYGVLAVERGTVVGVSENPPAVQVKWDHPGLCQLGAAGRWEETYNVQLAD